MDNTWERDARTAEDKRRAAVRKTQLSTGNVYGFRRLKWGLPKLLRNGTAGGQAQFSIADLLLVVIIFSLFGLVATLAWPH